ncbi:MAG TPA: hypothetical protein VHE30_14560 [Polyangiaceae bacterium]|nr:hypothetical protein [Polyangiaceae bacterium]
MRSTLTLTAVLLSAACSDDSSTGATPRGTGGSSGGAVDAGAGTGAGGVGSERGGTENAGGANGGGAAGSAPIPDAGTDATGARHAKLATTGAQLVVSGPELGLELTPADLATDADVFAIHQEFYGLPWDAFENQTEPPAEWVAVMDRLATSAKTAKKPVFLSITMLDGRRQSLAPRTTIEQGQVKTTENWAAACYDFAAAADGASKKAAYGRYVTYMVDKFSPAYLNLAIEVNLFFEKCPAAAAGVIDVANAAYDAVKQAHPGTVVFPSIQIDHLYGYANDACPDQTNRKACFDAAYAAISPLRRDRFAMSSYPYMNTIGTPANLPLDWFSRGAAVGGETPLVAETGWPSTDIVARLKDGTCPTIFSFTEAESAEYLARVLSDAETTGMDLVTWWSNRDLVAAPLMTDCPCSFDATWCAVLDLFRGPPASDGTDPQFYGEILLKAFGTMGIRSYDGTPKAAHYAEWSDYRARALVTR